MLKKVHLNPAQRIGLLTAVTVGITLFDLLTPSRLNITHRVFHELYFLPVLLGAYWFGLAGGLAVSLIVTSIYLPIVGFSIHDMGGDAMASLTQVAVFNITAVVIGILRERDKARQQELAEATGLAAMGRAVSSIAHDMKTPLMAIGGFVNQVKRKLPPEDPAAHKLEIVLGQVSLLEAMIKDMLLFARPNELDLAPGSLNDLLGELAEVLGPKAKVHGVALRLDLSETLPPVKIDRNRMEQAVVNLVNNALEASPAGETVVLSSYASGPEVYLEVRDKGPGIPQEKRRQILEPFFTTKKEGTGLGLPIVQKVAVAHGGWLEIKDNPDKGLRFIIVLPAQ